MSIISRTLRKLANWVDSVRDYPTPFLREEFSHVEFSGLAVQKLIDEYAFRTVLDIGSGDGLHSDIFMRHGKIVTAIDYGQSVYFNRRQENEALETIVADFNNINLDKVYDCVWCSHVLEHQLDTHSFLLKAHQAVKEGGVLAITVPPLKHEIVGGHVSLWNIGLLLYRLVLAGFDCSSARALQYGYNQSVLVEKKSINVMDTLTYDAGDIRRIRKFLPHNLVFHSNKIDDLFFGNIMELNWKMNK